MGLIGESWYRRRRNTPAGKGKERARSSSRRLPRFRIEVLETRVLLFGGQIPQALQLIASNAESPQAAIQQMLPWSPLAEGNVALADYGDGGSPLALPIGSPAGGQQQSGALFIARPILAAPISPALAIEGGALVLHAVPVNGPMLVTMGSESASLGGGVYEPTFTGPGTVSFNTSETATLAGGATSLSITTGASPIPEFGAPKSGPVIADGRYFEVSGSVGPGDPVTDVTIPLGLGTIGMKLMMRAESDTAPSEQPVMEDLMLDDQTGTTIQAFSPPTGPGAAPAQNLYLALHDAPVDGHLVVQVTTASVAESAAGTSAAGTSTPASPAAGPNVSFTLYVQRQQSPELASESAMPAQGQTALGTVTFQSSSLAADPSSATTVSTGDADNGAPAAQEAAIASSTDTGASSEAELPDGFNLRVLTGPLASRSSGPLGPILADAEVDPTPPVDRHERALIQDIEGLEQDDGPVSTLGRPELAGTAVPGTLPDDSLASVDDPEDGGVVRVPHARGLALAATAHQSGRARA